MSGNHQSRDNISSGNHECLHKIVLQSISEVCIAGWNLPQFSWFGWLVKETGTKMEHSERG